MEALLVLSNLPSREAAEKLEVSAAATK